MASAASIFVVAAEEWQLQWVQLNRVVQSPTIAADGMPVTPFDEKRENSLYSKKIYFYNVYPGVGMNFSVIVFCLRREPLGDQSESNLVGSP